MIPRNVGKLLTIGRKPRTGIEVIPRSQDIDVRIFSRSVSVHRYYLIHDILGVRIGVVLSYHDETLSFFIVVPISKAIAATLTVGCNGDWFITTSLNKPHESLRAEFRVEYRTIIAAKSYGSASIFMNSGPYVGLLGSYIHCVPLRLVGRGRIVSTEYVASTFLRPTFEPKQRTSCVNIETTNTDTTSGNSLGCDGGFPCTEGGINQGGSGGSRGLGSCASSTSK
mmetsp:Transcript_32750/g.71851  ORF Transcript_32750/g.71851 Transcript_32750/m.71851 type:complete len:225 (+) Transcript_32750:1462-2136(+)